MLAGKSGSPSSGIGSEKARSAGARSRFAKAIRRTDELKQAKRANNEGTG
jgi:hypothetical protein